MPLAAADPVEAAATVVVEIVAAAIAVAVAIVEAETAAAIRSPAIAQAAQMK